MEKRFLNIKATLKFLPKVFLSLNLLMIFPSVYLLCYTSSLIFVGLKDLLIINLIYFENAYKEGREKWTVNNTDFRSCINRFSP